MKEILKEVIDLSVPEGYEKGDIEFDIKRAVLTGETGTLRIEAELNFVLPYEAVDRFKRSLQGRLPDVHDRNIALSYRDIIQTREDILGVGKIPS